MWSILLYIFLFHRFETISSSLSSIRVIHNVSLVMFDVNSTTINATCDECQCAVLLNATSFSSFNCFTINNTCEMFSKSPEIGFFTLVNDLASSFYFIPLSTNETTSTTTPITPSSFTSETTIKTPIACTEYLWSFDSTFQDLTSTLNGIPINGAGFSSSTITGYGSSLSLTSALNQSVLIDSPFLNFSSHSWTVEAWIYPWTLSTVDNSIIGQCEALASDKCLRLVIKNGKMHIGFYGDSLNGVTTLVASKWYHVAYVFDNDNLTQSVYLNGIFDSDRTTTHSYLGNSGSLMIGTNSFLGANVFFDGLIDQLYYVNRSKTTSEILDDATLTLYFSFDNGSIYNGGPLHINGSRVGTTAVVNGRVGDALQLGSSSGSYFTISGLVLLGTSNQSYSMSIWIKPNISHGSIIHVSMLSTGRGWCIGMLGISASGQLIATSWQGGAIAATGPVLSLNTWTHAAVTYSTTNGLRLYVNGSLSSSAVSFSYLASGVANYLFVGNPISGSSCSAGTIAVGQYSGAVDEFRLYSRELTAADVVNLANP